MLYWMNCQVFLMELFSFLFPYKMIKLIELRPKKKKKRALYSDSFFMAGAAKDGILLSHVSVMPAHSHFSEQLCQDFIQGRLYATQPFQTLHLIHLY